MKAVILLKPAWLVQVFSISVTPASTAPLNYCCQHLLSLGSSCTLWPGLPDISLNYHLNQGFLYRKWVKDHWLSALTTRSNAEKGEGGFLQWWDETDRAVLDSNGHGLPVALCTQVWFCCRFISPSTTLPYSTCTTSPAGSHRAASVKAALEQIHPACPESSWHRKSSVCLSVPHSIYSSDKPWLIQVRTLQESWSTAMTSKPAAPSITREYELQQQSLLLLAEAPLLAVIILNQISEGL